MLIEQAFLMRVLERITISLIIISISIIFIIAFWKSMQKIDFDIKGEKNSANVNVVFATPIFVLLVLIGYAYISFSNPLKGSVTTKTDSFGKVTNEKNEMSFLGGSKGISIGDRVNDITKLQEILIEWRKAENVNKSKIVQIYNYLKVIKRDRIKDKFGNDFVIDCEDKEFKNFDDSECKKIRNWLKQPLL
jgi:hypothetical protein